MTIAHGQQSREGSADGNTEVGRQYCAGRSSADGETEYMKIFRETTSKETLGLIFRNCSDFLLVCVRVGVGVFCTLWR